jgi:ribonucleoside-diphosphate reductase beta chain
MDRYVIKKTGEKKPFEEDKIRQAVLKAMRSVDEVDEQIAEEVVRDVTRRVLEDGTKIPTVEQIHNTVEDELMNHRANKAAKSYIVYRSKKRPDIFRKRTNLKPYEYPKLADYVDAIRHSYWVHTEFNYNADIQDMKVTLNERERQTVTRAMLAISQIEIAVKSFWGDIYKKIPKPEIGNVGATFAESEVRHADAYSHLITIMGLNDEFEKVIEVPSIRKRIKYLERVISGARDIPNEEYFESVILFSMFVENISLFSQFLIIMSFNKFKNALKGISNAVEATSKEEQIHAEFGFEIINTIKEENPGWWTDSLITDIKIASLEAWDAERDIVEWMFEAGDLDFLTKAETLEFIRHRLNRSLGEIGIDPIFEIDEELLAKTEWFDDETIATKHTDFFNKRSINYTKRQQSVTADDLF